MYNNYKSFDGSLFDSALALGHSHLNSRTPSDLGMPASGASLASCSTSSGDAKAQKSPRKNLVPRR